MIEIAIGAVAFGAGLLATKLRRRNAPKHPCPWALCGYPLSDTPLVKSKETATHFASYEDETCPACGQGVSWCRFAKGYVRVPTPKK